MRKTKGFHKQILRTLNFNLLTTGTVVQDFIVVHEIPNIESRPGNRMEKFFIRFPRHGPYSIRILLYVRTVLLFLQKYRISYPIANGRMALCVVRSV